MAEGASGQSTGTEDGYTAEAYNREVEKRQTAEAERADLIKRLDAFKGIDPDEYKANKEALDRLQRERIAGDPKALEEWQANKDKELQERYSGKLSEYETENISLKKELAGLKIVTPAMLKAADVINSSELDMVQILVERDLMLVNGEIRVRGKDGKPIASVKNPRNDMDLAEYLQGIADAHPSWAKPSQQAGSKQGGSVASGSSPNLTAERYVELPRDEQMKLSVKERGTLAREAMRKGLI